MQVARKAQQGGGEVLKPPPSTTVGANDTQRGEGFERAGDRVLWDNLLGEGSQRDRHTEALENGGSYTVPRSSGGPVLGQYPLAGPHMGEPALRPQSESGGPACNHTPESSGWAGPAPR